MSASSPDTLDRRWLAHSAALAGSVACTLWWLLRGAQWVGATNVALIGTALLLHGVTWWRPPSELCSRRTATVVAGVVLVAAAVIPLHHSRDLYLYDIYGRAVSEHQVSPYRTTPAQLDDPNIDFVAEEWHDQPSMYGPAFIGLASVVSIAGGDSELLIRWSWQLVMAGAAFAAVVLVGRRARAPSAMLALACSPVLLATVNDAHNDVLIGLGLLIVALLLDEHRYLWAAAFAALAITTKVPAAFPVAAAGAWLLWRRGWRDALRFGAPTLAAVAAAYLAVGGSVALSPLRESAGDDSRFAIWQPLRDRWVEELLAEGVRWRVALDTVRNDLSNAALVLSVIVLLVALWRYRRAARVGEVIGIAGVTLMITSTYVMPWYPAMFLPVVALAWRSRAAVLVQVQAAFLLLAYARGPGVDPTTWLGREVEERAFWFHVAVLVAVVCWARPSETVSDMSDKRRKKVAPASDG